MLRVVAVAQLATVLRGKGEGDAILRQPTVIALLALAGGLCGGVRL